MEITCTKCKISKSIDLFRKRINTKSGCHSWCKECEYKHRKPYIPKIKPKRIKIGKHYNDIKRENKERMLKWRYGLSIEEYKSMYDNQNGCCAICKIPKELGTKKGLFIDHNHITLKIRGLLCSTCNSGLGKFKDDVNLLKKAIEYLSIL